VKELAMRIDGASGMDRNGPASNGLVAPKARLPEEAVKADSLPDDPQIVCLYRKYLPQVSPTEEIDLQAVAEARRLMESGQLDTPEAIRRAADGIARDIL
jgi:hypothetical protein